MPDRNDGRFPEAVVEAACPVVQAARGCTFFLCTSLRAMRRTRELLQEKIEAAGLDGVSFAEGTGCTSRRLSPALRR